MISVPNRVSSSRPQYSFPSLFTFLTGLVLLFSTTVAYAAVPNILGTYSGTVTSTEFNCGTGAPGNPPLFPNETNTDNLTLTISNQSGTSWSGSGTAGDGGNVTFSGTVDDIGNVNGSLSTSDPSVGTGSGTFSGTISGGTLSFSFSGQDDTEVDNILCQFTGSATLSLTGGDIIANPEITPGSTFVAALLEGAAISGYTNTLSNRTGNTLRGFRGGPTGSSQLTPTANGLAYEGGISGLNAGDGVISYGAWLSYSYSDFDNDLSSTALDGERHSVLGGFDFAPWESTVLGIAVGYESSDIDTTFNRGNVEADGYTIAPYFGYLLTDTWSVDFSFGYSSIDYDQFRTAPVTGTRVTSSTDADRWFGAFNLNGVTYYNNWILGGRVGTLWAKNEVDAFTESDTTSVADLRTKLGTWSIGGDVAYSYGDFEPFVRATYEQDYSMTEIAVTTGPQPDNDRDDVLLAAGVRYFGANNGISGYLDWTRRLGRENFDEDTFTASIRVDF